MARADQQAVPGCLAHVALPAGFVLEEDARGRLAVREDLRAQFAAAGWGLAGDGSARASTLFGRAPLQELELVGARYVVRRFTHGGLLRWLTGTRFLESERPFREMVLAQALRAMQLPTPAVVAARALRSGPGLWRLDVVTERIENSLDLAHALAREDLEPRVRRQLVAAAGALVRRLHDQGFLHADLTPRNLLVDLDFLAGRGANPTLWVLDLDRSVQKPELSIAERQHNVRRLLRHVTRLLEKRVMHLQRTDLMRFLCAYEARRLERRAFLAPILRAHARSLVWHRTGWALEKKLSTQQRDPGAV